MSKVWREVFEVIWVRRSETVASCSSVTVEAPPGPRNLIRMVALVVVLLASNVEFDLKLFAGLGFVHVFCRCLGSLGDWFVMYKAVRMSEWQIG